MALRRSCAGTVACAGTVYILLTSQQQQVSRYDRVRPRSAEQVTGYPYRVCISPHLRRHVQNCEAKLYAAVRHNCGSHVRVQALDVMRSDCHECIHVYIVRLGARAETGTFDFTTGTEVGRGLSDSRVHGCRKRIMQETAPENMHRQDNPRTLARSPGSQWKRRAARVQGRALKQVRGRRASANRSGGRYCLDDG